MHDPFSQFESNGLDARVGNLIAQLELPRQPTKAHVHALLAYRDQEGVKEKFDARFGVGAAQSIIDGASKVDLVLALREAVDELGEKIDALADRVKTFEPPDMSEMAEKLQELPEQIKQPLMQIAERMENLPGQIEKPLMRIATRMEELPEQIGSSIKVPDFPEFPEYPKPPAVDMSPVAMALSSMAEAIRGLSGEVKALKDQAAAPRHIINDVNGNPIGVRIGD